MVGDASTMIQKNSPLMVFFAVHHPENTNKYTNTVTQWPDGFEAVDDGSAMGSLVLPRLYRSDRRTRAELKTVTSQCSFLNRFNYPLLQVRRTSVGHGALPRSQITRRGSALPGPREIPDSNPTETALVLPMLHLRLAIPHAGT